MSCLVRAEGLSFPAKATTPGESARRGGHRGLEREEVAFPEKKALKEGRTIVFCDQSGFYLLCRRWFAPDMPQWGRHLSSMNIYRAIIFRR